MFITSREQSSAEVEYDKPICRGVLHSIFFYSVVPISLGFLWYHCRNDIHHFAMLFFTIASMFLYGASSVYHDQDFLPTDEDLKQELFFRKLDHLGILTNCFLCEYVVCLLAFGQTNLLLFLYMTFYSSFMYPFCVQRIFNKQNQHISAYLKQCLVCIPFIPFVIYYQSESQTTWLLYTWGFYVVGFIVYMSKQPNFSSKWFGYHEVFHLCICMAYITSCIYIYSSIVA
jgi:hemolysin III